MDNSLLAVRDINHKYIVVERIWGKMDGYNKGDANKGPAHGEIDEELLEDILKHLDGELEKGALRMSVTMDEKSHGKEVSHKCCNSYGRPATETVGLLDMYTDLNAGEPDRRD